MKLLRLTYTRWFYNGMRQSCVEWFVHEIQVSERTAQLIAERSITGECPITAIECQPVEVPTDSPADLAQWLQDKGVF